MPIITKSAAVTAEQAGRIDLVVRTLTELSRSQVRGLFDHHCVTLNDLRCEDPGTAVEAGDQVVVRYDPNRGYREKPKAWVDRAFSIVFEDDHLIVVNKAPNVLTVATERGEENTLFDRVGVYLSHARKKREPGVVHRLDRGVSGLLVFGKSPQIVTQLQDQFKQRKPERSYVAIVAGEMQSSEGTFQSYLETGNNLDRFSTFDQSKGQLAITHYRVLKGLDGATVVEVRLETGRRNQIRVHFADAGHPVLGDPRYGSGQAVHPRWVQKRLALHAVTLGLTHPVTGKAMLFRSELPQPLQKFINGRPLKDAPELPQPAAPPPQKKKKPRNAR
ncbi:RluA family pseudouridine synthase [Candidatus Laterigemmans baculatus]|uniref:RluA family pseudouridine synthase n=1 Tax=Candidatus Laterigemmans baculatus TaxID=2770505 RepID=UPI0013D9F9FF|nr:RluA family pseudouridine synthase [Candidatus Laterigemmans baculatus]